MRILIADESSDESPARLEALVKAVSSASFKSAGKGARSEAASIVYGPSATTDSEVPPIGLADQPEQLSAILDALGIALLNRGHVPQGRKLIVLALEIRKKFFGRQHPAVASSLTSYARVLRMEGDLLRGSKTIQEALRMNKKFFGTSGLPLVTSYVEAGVLQLYQGNANAAGKAALRGLTILKRHGVEANDPNTSRLLDTLGRALESRGRLTSGLKARALFAAANRALTKSVKLDLKQVGRDHPKYATHRANLASVQWAQDDLVAAEEGFREAIRVYENLLKRPLHPNLIDAYANLGSVLTVAGASRYTEAEQALTNALTRNEKSRGATDTLVGNDHANLGRLYYKQGDPRSKGEFETALAIYLANVKAGLLPRNHPYIQEAKDWLKKPCP